MTHQTNDTAIATELPLLPDPVFFPSRVWYVHIAAVVFCGYVCLYVLSQMVCNFCIVVQVYVRVSVLSIMTFKKLDLNPG